MPDEPICAHSGTIELYVEQPLIDKNDTIRAALISVFFIPIPRETLFIWSLMHYTVRVGVRTIRVNRIYCAQHQ